MPSLFPRAASDCESSRRRFLLQVGSLAGLGLSLDTLLRYRAASAATKAARAGDVNCILIWTRGGTSHHDTLDPKPEARAEVRGEFGVIGTALPGGHPSIPPSNSSMHGRTGAFNRSGAATHVAGFALG